MTKLTLVRNPRPICPKYWLLLARRRTGYDDTGAIVAYRKVIDLQPSNVDAYLELGMLYQRSQQWNQAYWCYSQARKFGPSDARGWYMHGRLIEVCGGSELAVLRAYHAAIARRPDYAEAHAALGQIYAGLGDREQAFYHLSLAESLVCLEEDDSEDNVS